MIWRTAICKAIVGIVPTEREGWRRCGRFEGRVEGVIDSAPLRERDEEGDQTCALVAASTFRCDVGRKWHSAVNCRMVGPAPNLIYAEKHNRCIRRGLEPCVTLWDEPRVVLALVTKHSSRPLRRIGGSRARGMLRSCHLMPRDARLDGLAD